MIDDVDFDLTDDQTTIRKAVAELAGKFDDRYWLERDEAHEFPTAFYCTSWSTTPARSLRPCSGSWSPTRSGGSWRST